MRKEKFALAFTLAEVLITLGILGVVMAMTLPAFMKSYKQKAYNQHVQVFSQKLVEATKQMNIRDDLTPHSDTNDFVNVFKRYIKIVKICDSSHLGGCFTNEIRMGDEIVSIDDLSTSENFGKKSYKTGNVGVNFLDGISVILSYNPDCPAVDPYNLKDYDTSSCLSYILDVNGLKKPNKIGQDIYTVGVQVTLPKKNQYIEINCQSGFHGYAPCTGSKINVDIVDSVTSEYLGTSNNQPGANRLSASANGAKMSWALAKKTCEDKGMRLPNATELHNMYVAASKGEIAAFNPDNYWASWGDGSTVSQHNCYMGSGGGNCGSKDVTAQNYVRCVE